MYIVREKSTKRILHTNPAPLSQKLEGSDIYYQFDSETMEVGRSDLSTVPEHFHIDREGSIHPWTLQEQVKAGVLKLSPEHKIVDNQIVEKTLAEKIADGLVHLLPTQILEGDRIREMTEGEKVAAGLRKLEPTTKLVDDHIVPKSLSELVQDGTLLLEPDEEIVENRVVRLTPRQMLDAGRYDFERFKEVVLKQHTRACLMARQRALPDHEVLYAAIGALSEDRMAEYREIIKKYVGALEEARATIQQASTADEVEAVLMNYDRLGDRLLRAKSPSQNSPAPRTPQKERGRRKRS
jgi:hypothetical protein